MSILTMYLEERLVSKDPENIVKKKVFLVEGWKTL